jgi:hypothetical protein
MPSGADPKAAASRPRPPPPHWLRRWRILLKNFYRFLKVLDGTILRTMMMNLHPNIRDRQIYHFYQNTSVQTTAPTLTTPAQHAITSKEYVESPETCSHDEGTHVYGAGRAGTLAICQKCGMRWQKTVQKQAVHWNPVQPKAGPATKTPLVARAPADGPSAPSSRGLPSRLGGVPFRPPTRSGSGRPTNHLIGTPPCGPSSCGPSRVDMDDVMSVTTVITGLADEDWTAEDYAATAEADDASVATLESEVP